MIPRFEWQRPWVSPVFHPPPSSARNSHPTFDDSWYTSRTIQWIDNMNRDGTSSPGTTPCFPPHCHPSANASTTARQRQHRSPFSAVAAAVAADAHYAGYGGDDVPRRPSWNVDGDRGTGVVPWSLRPSVAVAAEGEEGVGATGGRRDRTRGGEGRTTSCRWTDQHGGGLRPAGRPRQMDASCGPW